MQDTLFTVKIERMKAADIEQVIAIEAEAYGEHHWSKESFLTNCLTNLPNITVPLIPTVSLSVMLEAGKFLKKPILQILRLQKNTDATMSEKHF